VRTRRLVSWVICSPLSGLVIVLLIGVAVRLPYLSQRSIWFDEASSWRTASLPLPEMLQSIRQNIHAPLYYVLLKCWMMIFGDSAAALRSLSVLFGAATILGMYLFGREVYLVGGWNRTGKQTTGLLKSDRDEHCFAMLLASLVALSPFQIDASIESKMYSLGTALMAFSSWLLLRALRAERSTPLWDAYAFTILGLLYTHHYAVFSIGAQLAFLGLLLAWRALRGNGREVLLLVRRLLIPGVLVAVAYLPWMLVLKEQAARVQKEYWTQPLTWDMVETTLGRLVFPIRGFWSALELQAIVAVIAFLLLAAAWRPRRANVLVLASATMPFVLAAVISLLYSPIWAPRYFRFAQLFVLAITTIAIWRIPLEWLRGLAGWLALVSLAGLTIDYWAERDIPHRPGMRGVMERIYAQNKHNAAIIVTWSVHYFSARYYAPPGVEVRLLSSDSPIPHYHGGPIVRQEDFISPDEVQARLSAGVWIISPAPHEVRGTGSRQVSGNFRMEYDTPTHSPIWAAHYRKVEAHPP
jgi:mannosyltransferase